MLSTHLSKAQAAKNKVPGLLKVPSGQAGGTKFLCALVAEFVGTTIFSLFGSSTTLQGTTNSSLNNAIGNGISLAVVIYATANVSGAHINPAVTLAALVAGYISLVKAAAYVCCQIAGGIVGSLLLAALVHPEAQVGQSVNPSGCFAKAGITSGQLFGWELILTFTLAATVLAVAVGEPNFGVLGPLAVGLSLVAGVLAAGRFTGGAVNPARALGPSIVFGCNWRTTWVYVLAELSGGLIAGVASIPLYGLGPFFAHVTALEHPDAGSDRSETSGSPAPENRRESITHTNRDTAANDLQL